jgi:hypothetical protein
LSNHHRLFPRTFGQASNIGGDSAKPFPVLTSHRRLNGRVQSQAIGLMGNTSDSFDNIVNFA